jgi:hypothetical protein
VDVGPRRVDAVLDAKRLVLRAGALEFPDHLIAREDAHDSALDLLQLFFGRGKSQVNLSFRLRQASAKGLRFE